MDAGRRYKNGAAAEYRIQTDLETDGYACLRAAGSHGKADIIALKPGQILLVQVKRSNPQLTPADRNALLELARITGGLPIVAYKPPRKPVIYRQLTGLGPKDWRPFHTDQIEAAT